MKLKIYTNQSNQIIYINNNINELLEIYDINNLNIALPKAPTGIDKSKNQWIPEDYPKELKAIDSIFDWRDYPEKFK